MSIFINHKLSLSLPSTSLVTHWNGKLQLDIKACKLGLADLPGFQNLAGLRNKVKNATSNGANITDARNLHLFNCYPQNGSKLCFYMQSNKI
jgi:hypothetical protein